MKKIIERIVEIYEDIKYEDWFETFTKILYPTLIIGLIVGIIASFCNAPYFSFGIRAFIVSFLFFYLIKFLCDLLD